MPHDEPAGIGPGGELVVLAAVELHLLLVEAVPQVAMDDACRLVEALRIVDREWMVRQMRRHLLGDRRHDAFRRQPAPDRRQFLHQRTVAVALLCLGARHVLQPVRAGKGAVEIVEAPVLGIDHDERVDLVDAARRVGGMRHGAETCGSGQRREKTAQRHERSFLMPRISSSRFKSVL